MKKIKLTEEQLNRLVETTTVFKDEHKMKDAVDSELKEDSEKCECGCTKGECKCGPDCKKCDCGKEKETKEDWNPNASVATQPGGLMQGTHFPKWIQENKNNFKRLIK